MIRISKGWAKVLFLCAIAGALFVLQSCNLLNKDPTVSLSAPQTSITTAESVVITAAASDPDGDPLAYSWTRDGSPVNTNSPTYTFSSASAGTFSVGVTVADDHDNTATDSISITVTQANQPPTVSLSASPTTITTAQSSLCTASASDPDGDTLAYSWTRNGSPVGTNSPTYTFSSASVGTFTIGVTVTDGHAHTATDSISITVTGNQPPTVSLSASPTTITTAQSSLCTASASDPDGDTLSYSWTADSSPVGSNSPTYTFTSATLGGHTIAVTVNDGHAHTATDSVTVTVTAVNHVPTVSLSADDYTVYTDQNVTFTASGFDLDGDTLTYSWAVNSVPQSQTTSSVIYYWLGNTVTIYPTISVTVNDGHGHTATAVVSITVYSASSVRYVNVSSYTIFYIYMCQIGNSWSADFLGSNVLPNGYTFTVYGLPNDYFAFQADTSGHSLIWVTNPGGVLTYYLMQNGYHRNFQLNPTTWSLSILLNSSIEAPSEAQGPSESKPPLMLAETKKGSPAGSQLRRVVPGVESDLGSHDPGQPFEALK